MVESDSRQAARSSLFSAVRAELLQLWRRVGYRLIRLFATAPTDSFEAPCAHFSHIRELAKMIDGITDNPALQAILDSELRNPEVRREFVDAGFDLWPKHFYSPFPEIDLISSAHWTEPTDTGGIDWRLDEQLTWLEGVLVRFGPEIDWPDERTSDPTLYYRNNESFGPIDAEILYFMLRDHQPRRVIEIGCGNTTRITAQALRRNAGQDKPTNDFICIDPYSEPGLEQIPGISEVIRSCVQDIPIERFAALRSGDVLFIDSTHVLKIGSDVVFEYSQILPRLAIGVIVHVHDIFLPYEYPRHWVEDNGWAWNEQHLLHAILANSDRWQILWSGFNIQRSRIDDLIAIAPSWPVDACPGSLWMRRVR
jgi:hypothetical protein